MAGPFEPLWFVPWWPDPWLLEPLWQVPEWPEP